MKVTKTVKIEMTEEEKKALKTVYHMLYDLEREDERVVADELGYGDLAEIRVNLATLYILSGGCEEDLQ